jgi:hypothetical protein
MFRKDTKVTVAIDEEAGVRIDFNWASDRGESGEVLYEIIGGPGFILTYDIERFKPGRGFHRRERLLFVFNLQGIRQNQGRSMIGPAAVVTVELRERIASDLLAATHCLGLDCEFAFDGLT